MKTRIFISDIHIGAKRKPGPGGSYSYDWLSQGEAEQLIGFLNFLNSKGIGKEDLDVILLGDIFDNWVCPHFEVPPSFQDIITANKEIISAISMLSKKPNTKCFFTPGNHDMGINRSLFNKNNELDKVNFITNGIYASDGILAKHGHQHDWFNNPDFFQYEGLPLGYYISRAYATKMANEYCPPKSTVGIVFEFITNNPDLRNEINEYADKSLIAYIFKLILKSAGLRWTNTTFKMPDGNNIDAKNIIDELNKKANFNILKYLNKTNQNFINSAKNESLDNNINVVIYGHTHKVDLLPLDLTDNGSGDVTASDYSEVYANSGTWCETPQNQLSYIEIQSDNTYHNIRKMQWLGNKVKQIPMENKFVSDTLIVEKL